MRGTGGKRIFQVKQKSFSRLTTLKAAFISTNGDKACGEDDYIRLFLRLELIWCLNGVSSSSVADGQFACVILNKKELEKGCDCRDNINFTQISFWLINKRAVQLTQIDFGLL